MTLTLYRTPQTAYTPAPMATYGTFDEAFKHFNATLFGNTLPPVLITMQRRRGARGYFSADVFASRHDDGTIIDEIAMNPGEMQGRTDKQIASTLAHEMAHLWQEHFGKRRCPNPPARGLFS
jgi:hypothetical protein